MHFHSFHQESVILLLLCASLTSRVPRSVRPPEIDLGTYCLLHLCGLSGLQEHQDGAGSTRPHLFQSRAGYNAQARQTAPGNRFGIQLATCIPLPFRFLELQRGSRKTEWSRQYVSTSIPGGRLSDSSPYQCARSTAKAKADVKLQSISKGRAIRLPAKPSNYSFQRLEMHILMSFSEGI